LNGSLLLLVFGLCLEKESERNDDDSNLSISFCVPHYVSCVGLMMMMMMMIEG